MFVRYSTDVPLALGEVEKKIDGVRSNLSEWADTAYRDGEGLRATVGPGPDTYAKKVRLQIGMAEIRKAGVVYPVNWTATGASGLFPRLSADLVLSHVGKNRTQMTLEGTYDPPLGPVGRAIDRVVLRNVAEATIKNWVDHVASAVSNSSGSTGG